MKKPKFSVAASTTKKPKTTFSRFTRPAFPRSGLIMTVGRRVRRAVYRHG